MNIEQKVCEQGERSGIMYIPCASWYLVLNSYSALAHSFFVDPFIFACTVEILVEIL